MNKNNLYKQFETDALTWVNEASTILTSQEQSFTIAKQKDIGDVATSADVAVEAFLTKKILEKYPDHGIFGEESGVINTEAKFCWVIDPLDCTKEYVKGIGEYNILVAVEEHKEIVTGVVKRFGHAVTYTASRGNGAHMEHTPMHVSKLLSLETAFIGMNLPNKFKVSESCIDEYMQLYASMIKSVYRLRFYMDDATLFAWVAQGAHDGAISLPNSNKWYDVAPALLLVEEAGGKVTDWEDNPLKNHDLSKGIVVSNGLLHEQLLAIIKEAI